MCALSLTPVRSKLPRFEGSCTPSNIARAGLARGRFLGGGPIAMAGSSLGCSNAHATTSAVPTVSTSSSRSCGAALLNSAACRGAHSTLAVATASLSACQHNPSRVPFQERESRSKREKERTLMACCVHPRNSPSVSSSTLMVVAKGRAFPLAPQAPTRTPTLSRSA